MIGKLCDRTHTAVNNQNNEAPSFDELYCGHSMLLLARKRIVLSSQKPCIVLVNVMRWHVILERPADQATDCPSCFH